MVHFADSKVTILDWQRRLIGGFVVPYGNAQHLTLAGKSNAPGYKGHYSTPETRLYSLPSGFYLYADHKRDLGPIGHVLNYRTSPQGFEVQAVLYEQTGALCYESADRPLPKLLQQGLLYYSPRLDPMQLAPDGFLISAIISEASITEHPATPKVGKP